MYLDQILEAWVRDFTSPSFLIAVSSAVPLLFLFWSDTRHSIKIRQSSFLPILLFVSLGFVALFISQIFEFLFLSVMTFGIVALFAAPVVEEISKFFLGGRTRASGGSTGIGFAVLENAAYFIAFGWNPVFLALRLFSDPVLHSFTTSNSVKAKQGGKKGFWLLFAIAVHFAWNLASTILATSTDLLILFVIAAAGSMLVSLLWATLKVEKKRPSETLKFARF